jgi:microcystin-dependent protein
MADPFVGEVRMVGFAYAPEGWALCDGSLLDVNEYRALFDVLGNTYGGDGQGSFAVPDLRGRMAIHQGKDPAGNDRIRGQALGSETVRLQAETIPTHSHPATAVADHGTESSPKGATWAAGSDAVNPYSSAAADATLHGGAIVNGPPDAGRVHENMSPYLVINFIIAVSGSTP